ncbi:MAG TPA: acyloxyacyl hydrolase, partial [Rhabdochlamydiaceae bacterium]|nr:acyloxyacyl hydrolase [Rhabdochlamydiaceae bacterium]
MKKIFLILIGSFLGFSPSLHPDAQRPALVSLGVGVFNIVRPQRTVQYQIEYKWENCWYYIQPFVSFFITNHQSTYFCAGICADIFVTKNIVVTPSFAPGIYIKGHGKDLGFPLEFRSCLALSYQFKNCTRFGAEFYHISNASLGHRNPGEESLVFFFSFPP